MGYGPVQIPNTPGPNHIPGHSGAYAGYPGYGSNIMNSNVNSMVGSNVNSNVNAIVNSPYNSNIGSNVRSNVDSNVGSNVGSNIYPGFDNHYQNRPVRRQFQQRPFRQG